MEQVLPTLPEHLSSSLVFNGVRIDQSLVFYIVICPFVIFSFWSLCRLPVYLRLLIFQAFF